MSSLPDLESYGTGDSSHSATDDDYSVRTPVLIHPHLVLPVDASPVAEPSDAGEKTSEDDESIALDPNFDHEAAFLEKLDEFFELPTEPLSPDDAPIKLADDNEFFAQNTKLLNSFIEWDIINEKLPPGVTFSVENLTVQQTLNLLIRSQQRRHKQIFDERVGKAVYPGFEKRAERRRAKSVWTPTHFAPSFENGPDAPYSVRDEIKPVLVNTDEEDYDYDWSSRFNVNDHLLDEVLDAGQGSVKSLAVLNYIGFMFERYLPSHLDKSLPSTATKANIIDVIHGMYEAYEMFGEEDLGESFVNFHDSLTPLFGNLNEIRGFAKKLEHSGKIGEYVSQRSPTTPLDPPGTARLDVTFSLPLAASPAYPEIGVDEPPSLISSQSVTNDDAEDNHKHTDPSQAPDVADQNEHQSVSRSAFESDEVVTDADVGAFSMPLPVADAPREDNEMPSSLTDGHQQQAQLRVDHFRNQMVLTVDTELAQRQRPGDRLVIQQDPFGMEALMSPEPTPSSVAGALLHDEQETNIAEEMADSNQEHWAQGGDMTQWSAALEQFDREQTELRLNHLRASVDNLNTQNAMLAKANLALANQNTQLTTLLDLVSKQKMELEIALQSETLQKQQLEAKHKLCDHTALDLGTEIPKDAPPKDADN